MDIQIQNTEDGSQTVYSSRFRETYHSIHGAVTESRHVFIQAGLLSASFKEKIRIFEVGFGTGLNALLTYKESAGKYHVEYHSIEKHPLDLSFVEQIKYPEFLSEDELVFKAMHKSDWGMPVDISPDFRLIRYHADLVTSSLVSGIDVVYFDAFSPESQPELWTEDIFRRFFSCMNAGGVLTTYCAKGSVRRALQSVGFATQRLPGPPGKREMLRVVKA